MHNGPLPALSERLQFVNRSLMPAGLPDLSMSKSSRVCFIVDTLKPRRLSSEPDYTTQTPQVYTSVQIDWSRFLGYRTITEFLGIIASHVTNPSPSNDEYVSARQGIQVALTETLWENYGTSEYGRVFANDETYERELPWRSGVVHHP